MSLVSGGGAATNAGIDFQARVASFFMAMMWLDHDMSFFPVFGLEGEINSVQFESCHHIDDINIVTDNGLVYVQAKRSINLSKSDSSEFYNVVKQFLMEYIYGDRNGIYVLAVGPGASSAIKFHLKKIFDSFRLDSSGLFEKTMNASEKKAMDYFFKAMKMVLKDLEYVTFDENEYASFIKKVHVVIFELEEGLPLETSLLYLIRNKVVIDPVLVWSQIVAMAMRCSKNRQSVSSSSLKDTLSKYCKISTDIGQGNDSLFNYVTEGNIQVKYDFLIFEVQEGDVDYVVIQFYRFKSDCSMVKKFQDDSLRESGLKIVFRASSLMRICNYLNDNEAAFIGKKVVFVNYEPGDEYSECEEVHSQLLKNIAENKKGQPRCLHCGGPVSENDSYFVEVDYIEGESIFGIVHGKCLRPIDRVCGVLYSQMFDEFDWLKDFDFEVWAKKILYGQQGIRNAVDLAAKNGMVPVVAWNPDNFNNNGLYGVRMKLEDGSYHYARRRCRIERFSEEDILVQVERMKACFVNSNSKDYYSFDIENNRGGNYSTLIKDMRPGEYPLKVVDVDYCRYSTLLDEKENSVNYYAPIAYLEIMENEPVCEVLGCIFLFTTPLEIRDYVESMKFIGIELPEYRVRTLSDDSEFDKFVGFYLKNGMEIVIDPIFGREGELVSGMPVQNINDINNSQPH